jgi:hypothetical protein
VRSRGHGSAPRCWRTPRATRPRRTSNEVAGQCPRLAESLLRDGRFSGRVSAAASAVLLQPFDVGQVPRVVAARRPLQRSRLSCRFSGASTDFTPRASAAPRRSLRDGRFSGRVSAAASAVLLQSCVHVVGLGRSTSLLRDDHFTGLAYAVFAPKD